MIDLTRNSKTFNVVSAQLEYIIMNFSKYSLEELKAIFVNILENPKTVVSFKKKISYLDAVKHIHALPRMQMFLTNIYLAGANMLLTSKKCNCNGGIRKHCI